MSDNGYASSRRTTSPTSHTCASIHMPRDLSMNRPRAQKLITRSAREASNDGTRAARARVWRAAPDRIVQPLERRCADRRNRSRRSEVAVEVEELAKARNVGGQTSRGNSRGTTFTRCRSAKATSTPPRRFSTRSARRGSSFCSSANFFSGSAMRANDKVLAAIRALELLRTLAAPRRR